MNPSVLQTGFFVPNDANLYLRSSKLMPFPCRFQLKNFTGYFHNIP